MFMSDLQDTCIIPKWRLGMPTNRCWVRFPVAAGGVRLSGELTGSSGLTWGASIYPCCEVVEGVPAPASEIAINRFPAEIASVRMLGYQICGAVLGGTCMPIFGCDLGPRPRRESPWMVLLGGRRDLQLPPYLFYVHVFFWSLNNAVQRRHVDR